MLISRRQMFIEALLLIWLIGAQVWYYRQFAGLFRAAIRPIFHGVWH